MLLKLNLDLCTVQKTTGLPKEDLQKIIKKWGSVAKRIFRAISQNFLAL